MNVLVSAPAWLVVTTAVVLGGLLAVGFRLLFTRLLGDDRDLSSVVAGPLMPALGAVFALLAATSLATEVGRFRSAEDNVSAEAAAASRLAWSSTTPGIDGQPIRDDLVAYLTLTRAEEWDGGDRDGSPEAMDALAELERTVRVASVDEDLGSAQAGELLASLDSLTSLRRQRLATGTNPLPDLYIVVVVLSGLALIANSAALALGHRARVASLTAGLVVVVAVALALLLAVSAPFRGGFVVKGDPVDSVRENIVGGEFSS